MFQDKIKENSTKLILNWRSFGGLGSLFSPKNIKKYKKYINSFEKDIKPKVLIKYGFWHTYFLWLYS